MADTKISALTDGGAVQAGDEFVVARSGSDLKIAGSAMLVKLFDSTLGSDAASIDTGASAIPSGFSGLLIEASLRSTRASTFDNVVLRANGDSTVADYAVQYVAGEVSTASAALTSTLSGLLVADCPAASSPANAFGCIETKIIDYASAHLKSMISTSFGYFSTTDAFTGAFGGIWKSTTAINQITLVPNNGPNWKAGSRMVIYGLP